MKLLVRWLVSALALLGIAQFIPGIVVTGFYAALITALILGLINAIIRPLIILLTLPINILTLGLFTLVINAGLFWFVATFIEGFAVNGFVPAFWGALILSVVSWLLNWLISDK